ncbi:uncharacterized protein BO97DRAFT_413532 [Aspergillus homomorphus CBS 101889]|uniref:Serine hydrolase domain-containing protein n=1 Tax=Aspergillus homomorphus (strain CBS 101889) TaxID=1450537 RepID=A0A395HZE3_ASPHC|nr:hypothetical protein BO97DRAFT_413532 [Aspergillus homomorphus CBS 101889]RAL13067.1 hypothetical protein BO97DRAFT_413532 [Aspergillus homomorphus CBS 101889]
MGIMRIADRMIRRPEPIRVWTYTQSGLPSQMIVLEDEAPAPSAAELGPKEVLVSLNYVAMNSGFTTMMRSLPPQPYSLPHSYNRQKRLGTPEFEFSGRILAEKARSASARLLQLTSSSPCTLFKKMERLALHHCAGHRPDQAHPRRQALRQRWQHQRGHADIQVARHVLGPTGTIIAAATDSALVNPVGADEVINHRANDPLHEYLRAHHAEQPLDAIIDCVGVKDLYVHCEPYLREGKPFINLGAMTAKPTLWGCYRSFGITIWYPYGLLPLGVMRLVERREMRMGLDSVWEMQDAPKAYERMESKRAKYLDQFVMGEEKTIAYCDPEVPESCLKAVEDLERYIAAERSYDGVMGFSQGANVALSWLMKLQHESKGSEARPLPFKVGISSPIPGLAYLGLSRQTCAAG